MFDVTLAPSLPARALSEFLLVPTHSNAGTAMSHEPFPRLELHVSPRSLVPFVAPFPFAQQFLGTGVHGRGTIPLAGRCSPVLTFGVSRGLAVSPPGSAVGRRGLWVQELSEEASCSNATATTGIPTGAMRSRSFRASRFRRSNHWKAAGCCRRRGDSAAGLAAPGMAQPSSSA